MKWDLYQQRPILLHHPLGLEVRVAVVFPEKDGIIWLNLESLIKKIRLGMSRDFDSFIMNTVNGKPCFVEEKSEWYVRDSQGNLYKFALPSQSTMELWEQYKADITPEIESLFYRKVTGV